VGSFVDSGLLLSFTNIPVEAGSATTSSSDSTPFRQLYEPGLTNPTTGTAGCCSRAPTGQAAE
jgi:hypothetical protein